MAETEKERFADAFVQKQMKEEFINRIIKHEGLRLNQKPVICTKMI